MAVEPSKQHPYVLREHPTLFVIQLLPDASIFTVVPFGQHPYMVLAHADADIVAGIHEGGGAQDAEAGAEAGGAQGDEAGGAQGDEAGGAQGDEAAVG